MILKNRIPYIKDSFNKFYLVNQDKEFNKNIMIFH